jgi:hypothetical protein
MSGRTTRGSDFSRARSTRAPRSRDPLGKVALFSADNDPVVTGSESPIDPQHGRGASHLFSGTETRPGTLIVDCSTCGRQTRVTYLEFAALHFPVWLWLPTPERTHRHWLRCPTCHTHAWVRVGWLE